MAARSTIAAKTRQSCGPVAAALLPPNGRAPAVAFMWKVERVGPDEWRLKPVLLPDEIPPKIAAKLAGLPLSTFYRFVEVGILKKRQASPGKMLLSTAAVLKFKEDTRRPGFWDRTKHLLKKGAKPA